MAEVNVDFVGVRQNLTFLPNETLRTKKCITIQTNDDNIYEGVEQYGLHMRLDYRFAQENSPARLYIRENDGKRGGREGERERKVGGREAKVML